MRKWKKINGFLILFITFFSACAGFSSWNVNSSKIKGFNVNIDISKNKVAYFVDSDNKTRTFTSVEGALTAAQSGKEKKKANIIYVIPNSNPTIVDKTLTLEAADTLCIPYEDDPSNNVHNYFYEKYNSGINGNSFADNEVSKYRKNLITLIDSTINIDGTLQIGGRTGGSSNQGATTGYYCDLLRKNSVLNVKGTLESYGFIHADDSSSKSASIINLGILENGKTKTSAVLKTPTVFYDYGSANQIRLLVTNIIGGHKDQKVFPFEKFDVPQIRPTIKINFGSTLIGKVHTYGATAKDQTCEAGIVGEKDAFILLTEGSCLEWKYSDESKEITSNHDKLKSHKTEISIYGKALMGSLKVTVSGYDIISSEFYLPVPFGYYIYLKNGCELEFPNSLSGIKFMPGSCLTCEAGSQLNINTNTVFYQGLTSKDGSFTISYETSSPAKCLNSGTITINSGFEGVISTNQNKGKIITKENLQSVDNCKEVQFTGSGFSLKAAFYSYGWGGAKADFLKREFTFNGSIVEDEYASIGQRELAKNSVYQANKTNDGKYGWYNETYQSYGISFVLDDGDDVINPNGNSKHFNFYNNENVELEPLSNKDTNKTFGGFYYDSSLTDKLSCTSSGIYYVDPNYVKQKNYLGTEKYIKIYSKWITAGLITINQYKGQNDLTTTQSSLTSGKNYQLSDFNITGNDSRPMKKVDNVSRTEFVFQNWIIYDASDANKSNKLSSDGSFTPESGKSYNLEPVFKTNYYLYRSVEQSSWDSWGTTYYMMHKFKVSGSDTPQDVSEKNKMFSATLAEDSKTSTTYTSGWISLNATISFERKSHTVVGGGPNYVHIFIGSNETLQAEGLPRKNRTVVISLSQHFNDYFVNGHGPIKITATAQQKSSNVETI